MGHKAMVRFLYRILHPELQKLEYTSTQIISQFYQFLVILFKNSLYITFIISLIETYNKSGFAWVMMSEQNVWNYIYSVKTGTFCNRLLE